jgi:beta-glucosidase
MKTTIVLLSTMLLSYPFSWSQGMNVPKTEINRKVSELLSKMTLEEKVAQMTQMTVTTFEEKGKPGVFDMVKLRDAIQNYHLGSMLDVPNPQTPTIQRWKEVLKTINNEANKTQLKIPIVYGIDAIHGSSYTAGAT